MPLYALSIFFKSAPIATKQHAKAIAGLSNFSIDLGADSLDMAELVLSLEEEFDIMIDDVEVEGILTVEQMIVYIEDNING